MIKCYWVKAWTNGQAIEAGKAKGGAAGMGVPRVTDLEPEYDDEGCLTGRFWVEVTEYGF